MQRWICSAVASLATLVLLATGALEPFERPLLDLRMRLIEHTASPAPVLVEIDPRSIHEVGQWPWARSLHALLLDRLTAAGAAEVFLDVDFSLPSDEAEDATLEAALERRAGRTVLAAFRQWSPTADAYVDAGPLPRFARHARIASANMVPAADGLIREDRLSYPWRGGELPSFAAAIAGAEGDGEFLIDYGVRVESITRLAFVDVARGEVDPAILRGRPVVVGATAVELSDILPVPNHRVLPGAVVQMLAAQSLLLDRALQRLPLWCYVFAVPVFLAGLGWLTRCGRAPIVIGGFLGAHAILCGIALGLQVATPVLLDVMPFVVGAAVVAGGTFVLRFQKVAQGLVAETLSRLRAEKLMGTVAQNAFDALVTTDGRGQIRFVNKAASQMFGLSASEAQHMSIRQFVGRPEGWSEADLVQALRRIIKAGRPRRLVCRRRNGELFYADLTVSELADEERAQFILLVRDIDRRVKAERRLLARERELRRAKAAAELANQSKTEFLHNMSHELKTPLTAIIGFSELMEQQLLGPLGSEGYLAYATDIRESGQRLLHTVSDVLEFSRIEAGEYRLEEAAFDLVGLCDQMAKHLQARADKTGHQVDVRVPSASASYFGDERLIKLALNHVISNALKFTPAGGKVTFALHLDDSGLVRFDVRDTGIGIDPGEIESCFEPFRQANRGLERSHEGSGLGLTLAKRFVELHGGSITLRSWQSVSAGAGPGADSGASVAVTLPSSRLRSLPGPCTGSSSSVAALHAKAFGSRLS